MVDPTSGAISGDTSGEIGSGISIEIDVERPGEITLRPTSPDDLPTLRSLFTDPGIYEPWGGHPLDDDEIRTKYLGSRRPDVECFLVVEHDEPVGFVQFHRGTDGASDDGGPEVMGGGLDLALVADARGRGVGTKVVRAIIAHVRDELGWRRLTVDPDVSNPIGLAFWAAVGFHPVKRIDDEPGREPYWLMTWPTDGGVLATDPSRAT